MWKRDRSQKAIELLERHAPPRILLAGPLPPPAGGIATAVSDLLKSDLAKDCKIVHVDNWTMRSVALLPTPAEGMTMIVQMLLHFILGRTLLLHM